MKNQERKVTITCTEKQLVACLDKKRADIAARLEDITEGNPIYFALYQRHVYLGVLLDEFSEDK